MSWAALPVEPACMGKVGEGTRRPPMFVGLASLRYIRDICGTRKLK